MIASLSAAGSKRSALRGCESRIGRAAAACALWLAASLAPAGVRAQAAQPGADADGSALRLLRGAAIAVEAPAAGGAPAPTHRMKLELVVMARSGWSADEAVEAARQAGRVLAQCGIRIETLALSEFDGPARYRTLATRVSRELARNVRVGRPALFFVADTLHRPAFDAEAIGRANSRTRPEMADTVWITAGARDLPIVIAHELAHVLADSGEHSDEAGNLMREDTAPEHTRLTRAQCHAIVTTGESNGLLRRVQ